ncbi:MAG: radical SAM protein [Candidatus Poribacteria bacterium]
MICYEINQNPVSSCERAFFQESNALPKSLETQRPLSDFHIIGFSISFELDYFNILKTLLKAGIPIRSRERNHKYPFIIAGGICPSFNPEPLADFIDAFFIGDGEETIHEFLSIYEIYQSNRPKLLEALSEIKGIYIPSLYKPSYNEDGTLSNTFPEAKIEHRTVNLNSCETASKIITPDTEFANTFLLEVSRGCANRCKFCVSCFVQKYRIRSADNIIEMAKSDLARKAQKIGLVGSSVTDHPDIDKIAEALIRMGRKITVASLRADSVSEFVLDALVSSNLETITLAPEAGSDRLRKVIGKNIPIDKIYDVVQSAIKKGIKGIKLYFMIGLPTETQDDIEEIISVVKNVKKLTKPKGRISISISPFVPKPKTPFQLYAMESEKSLAKKLLYLKGELAKIGGVRFSTNSARMSAIQGVLSRGDRRLANVLYDMQTKNMSWQRSLKENNVNAEFYIGRQRDFNEKLPWDCIL